MFSYIYQPLIWVALASVAVGILGMLRRSIAAIRRFVLDINVLMVIAGYFQIYPFILLYKARESLYYVAITIFCCEILILLGLEEASADMLFT